MDLVIVQNNQPVTTSLQVAEVFGMEHKNVMQAVRKVCSDSSKLEEPNEINKAENSALLNSMFSEDKYTVEKNQRSYPLYIMNKDGFTLLVMGFTGKKATQFKLQYIAQFNKMEKQIANKQQQSLPQNYASALRQLAEQVEENEKLRTQLKQQDFEQGVIEQVEVKADVLYTTEEIALSLGYKSARALNKQMSSERVVYFRKGLWHLYAPYARRGLKDMSTRRSSQLWNAKGKEFIEIRFVKEN